MEDKKCFVCLQKSMGKNYMWCYVVRQSGDVLCSGGVYYSDYPNSHSAFVAIREELAARGFSSLEFEIRIPGGE